MKMYEQEREKFLCAPLTPSGTGLTTPKKRKMKLRSMSEGKQQQQVRVAQLGTDCWLDSQREREHFLLFPSSSHFFDDDSLSD